MSLFWEPKNDRETSFVVLWAFLEFIIVSPVFLVTWYFSSDVEAATVIAGLPAALISAIFGLSWVVRRMGVTSADKGKPKH